MGSRVLVVIPTFGRSDLLCRALDSVMVQSFRDFAIVVVDDNGMGTPESLTTEGLIQNYAATGRVALIQHPYNRSGSAARNTGALSGDSEFVAFLDDDDEFTPDRLRLQVSFLDRHPELDGCYCLSERCRQGLGYYRSRYKRNGNLIVDVLTLSAEMPTSSWLIRRSVFTRLGGFDESFKRHQDYEFLTRFFSAGSLFGCLPVVGLRYHEDNEMNRPSAERLIQIKEHFFQRLATPIGRLTSAERRRVLNAHLAELVVHRIRGGKGVSIGDLRCLPALLRHFLRRWVWSRLRLQLLVGVAKILSFDLRPKRSH